MELKKECKHLFEYKCEQVVLKDPYDTWFNSKRVIIFCKNCGEISHDRTNGNSYTGQDLTK